MDHSGVYTDTATEWGSPLLFHWYVFLGFVEAQSVMCMYSGHFFGINVIEYIITNLFLAFLTSLSL